MSTTTQPKKSTVKKTTSTTTVEQSTTNGSTTPEQPKRPSVASLQKRVDELQSQLDALPKGSDKNAFGARLEQIHQVLLETASEDSDNPYLASGRIRKLDLMHEALEVLSPQLEDFSARLQVTEGNVTELSGKHNRAVGRIFRLEQGAKSQRFPLWPVLLGVVIGVIFGIIWDNLDHKSVVPNLSGEPVFYSDSRNELWYAFLMGIVAFGVTTLIGLFIDELVRRSALKKDVPANDSELMSPQSYASAAPQGNQPITSRQDAEVTPTKPLPATQGVPVGTR